MSELINRRITYRLYPSASQELEMVCLHGGQRQLCNAALEERVDAWRKAQKSISHSDHCKSLTHICQQDPECLALNVQSAQVTLKRLDKTFAVFIIPQKHKPNQTDPIAGDVCKKPLSQPYHLSPDGRIINHNQAATSSMLGVGLRLPGQEPSWTQETAFKIIHQSCIAA